MEHIYQSVAQLIGGTPLMEAKAVEEKQQLKARLLLKLEYLNLPPFFSIISLYSSREWWVNTPLMTMDWPASLWCIR